LSRSLPGFAGAAVIANLSRVMSVIGRLKVAAAALARGQARDARRTS